MASAAGIVVAQVSLSLDISCMEHPASHLDSPLRTAFTRVERSEHGCAAQEYAGPESTKDPRPITERLKTLQQVKTLHAGLPAMHSTCVRADYSWLCFAHCMNRKVSGKVS